MNLTRKNWPLGWVPIEDERNGNKDALLKMKNLELDEEGIVSLVNGCVKINASPFAGYIQGIYSKYISNTKYRFVDLATYDVKILNTDGTINQSITGTSHYKAGFGSVFGQVLITAGTVFKKWDGTTLNNLGLPTPLESIATSTAVNQKVQDLTGSLASWTLFYGTDLVVTGDYVGATTNYFGGITAGTLELSGLTLDANVVDGVPGTPDDLFSIGVYNASGAVLDSVKLIFTLEDTPELGLENYYQFEWKSSDDENNPFKYGAGEWSTLSCRRKDFTRFGTNSSLDWSTVKDIKIALYTIDSTLNDFGINNLRITGGDTSSDATMGGILNGTYDYALIYVNDTGIYQAKSPLGVIAKNISIINGAAQINLADPRLIDSQINRVWLFRRNSSPSDVVSINEEQGLDKWYRVKQINLDTDALIFYDNTSDKDALTENFTANEFLTSVKDLTEDIVGIETNYYERTLYLTAKSVYLSERNNPDCIDPRYTIKLGGTPTEINHWLLKTSLGSLCVGSSNDIYEISGTLVDLPDGTLDASVKGFGTKFPPIAHDAVVQAGIIFYTAKDAIRSLSPSGSSDSITQAFHRLFEDEELYDIHAFYTLPLGVVAFPIAITQNKLWISIASKDSTRRLYAYDTNSKAWHYRWLFVTSLYVEEDGTLLGGFGEGEGGTEAYLRVLNTGNTIDVSTYPTAYQGFELQTGFDDNQQPRNRKDVFTLKITADSGNYPVNIQIAVDQGSFVDLGNYSFNGSVETLIRLEGVIDPGMSYALLIQSDEVPTFRLYNFSIEYAPFPEQLNFLRIPNNNLGTYSRKRITNYAFVIDTLGNSITFTPLIDGVSGTTSSVNFTGKRTFIHYFASETIGTDIGGTLHGGTFEYYDINLQEIVSEKLPVPVKFLIIPNNDYGNPNRKRHSSYKFQINTRGYNVRFTPKLDGVAQTPITINTSEKLTVEYFFSVDTIAIDIGGTLESLVNQEFEFYGVIVPQVIEVLPSRLKEFTIPENNYGFAARKRIRTMPMEINTNGYNVTFTPKIDGVLGTPATINTASKKTAFYYFATDSFGVDYSGELVGANAFEFYGLMKPEGVEVLPVGKKLDQIGPIRFDKIGKLLVCRLRLISTGDTTINVKFYNEDYESLPGKEIYTKALTVVANEDQIYEFDFPKTIKGSCIRTVIGPTTYPFHRYDMQLKVALSGMDVDPKWMKIK